VCNCLLVAARVAENQNDWLEAAKIWDELDRPTDANACRMIADAIKAGDLFRERARLLTTHRSLKQAIGG